MNCPVCGKELEKKIDKLYCSNCDKHFEVKYFCDKCNKELEVVRGCGSTSYFCNSCNELKSKNSVRKECREI